MRQEAKPVYLKDYRKPDFLIDEISLTVDIRDDFTVVTNLSKFRRQGDVEVLSLNGEKLKLLSVKLNGQVLPQGQYEVSDTHLTIPCSLPTFSIETVCRIYPQRNTALEGLYKSDSIYCTQNEPEGFRRMTYHLDRPDVMSRYTTEIQADKATCPVLLSNGNLKASGDLENGRHFAQWEDPFKKPCYLFALVAGDLAMVEDVFQTRSGKNVPLRIYVDPGNEHRTRHALDALKKAMKWDEAVFGLEYDLDIYMIVAVNAFNFGAMENKGLNIFNASAVLADPASSTDSEYERIEGIVAHEYFHNWTGNRVTCRDWFQITLKEGLTVFRDQEFTADITHPALKRIRDVDVLKNFQFPEDAGPTAHPIQPDTYLQINNFYTHTVYEKGAEVIRMVRTLLGNEGFKRGITKYFELYDGQAVTTEDFIHAMEIASGRDLSQFKRWYSQRGTPILQVEKHFDPQARRYTLRLRQEPPAFIKGHFKPLHFPLRMGLLDRKGDPLPLMSEQSQLEIKEREESFTFEDIKEEPIPSLLRDFSAPVILKSELSLEEFLLLFVSDPNDFNRYEAAQEVGIHLIREEMKAISQGRRDAFPSLPASAYRRMLGDEDMDPAFRAEMLSLPPLMRIVGEDAVIDYSLAHEAREKYFTSLARELKGDLLDRYRRLSGTPYSRSKESIARRKLKNVCLAFLAQMEEGRESLDLLWEQYEKADNMTDRLTALALLSHRDVDETKAALEDFERQWRDDGLVMDKWFAVQAASKREDVLKRILELERHSSFEKTNPNKVRSLYGRFTYNLPRFHVASGRGYAFLAERIIDLDPINPMAASGLIQAFKDYPRLDEERKSRMNESLEKILTQKTLSSHVYERALKIRESEK